jgi:hypothetical protein
MAKQKGSAKEDDKLVEQAFAALESELDKLGKAPPDRAALKASVARLREAVGKV